MLNIGEGRSIWLWTEVTDMRRSFNGLSAQVRRHLNEDPGQGDWYVFINRRRTQLKILAFEAGGYCLWSKRLEQGCFARPSSYACKLSLSRTALLALLDGIDIVIKNNENAIKKRHY